MYNFIVTLFNIVIVATCRVRTQQKQQNIRDQINGLSTSINPAPNITHSVRWFDLNSAVTKQLFSQKQELCDLGPFL